MADERSNSPLGQMNRRTMLGTSTALLGGIVVLGAITLRAVLSVRERQTLAEIHPSPT